MWPWSKERPPEIERRIKVNDAEFNAQFEYAQNKITTSKYSIITFVPKNLFEQFQRLANAYFLGLLILQLIPAVSSLNWVTTVIPLVFVLLISAVKESIDDFQRHRSDAQVNNRISYVLRHGELVEERWHKVSVGDIIKLKNNEFVAADLMVLSTSEPHSLCYIETAELDGETNLKVRQALEVTAEMADDHAKMAAFDAEIVSEPPNNRLSKFEGKMHWQGETYSLDNEKIVLRGCVLRNTEWCYGVVIFAGKDTKLMMNSGKTNFKRTYIDRFLNKLIIGIFFFLLTMCLICTVACGVWEGIIGSSFRLFLPWENFISEDKYTGALAIALLVFLSYIIILNTVVPISLYVSVEVIRLAHSLWINWDVKMYYEKSDTAAKTRTTTLNEELGQIEYIFSDKTGTLTQNIMSFNKCSINGKSYGDPLDREGNLLEITERKRQQALWRKRLAWERHSFRDSSSSITIMQPSTVITTWMQGQFLQQKRNCGWWCRSCWKSTCQTSNPCKRLPLQPEYVSGIQKEQTSGVVEYGACPKKLSSSSSSSDRRNLSSTHCLQASSSQLISKTSQSDHFGFEVEDTIFEEEDSSDFEWNTSTDVDLDKYYISETMKMNLNMNMHRKENTEVCIDSSGSSDDPKMHTPKVDFSANPYADKNFEFYDQELLDIVHAGDKHCHTFFLTLALCHTVMAETHQDGTLEYQAQSPDEGALVSAARNFGFVFKTRTPSTITIEVHGVKEVYDLLCILDFNNVRKRMSVIVRKDKKIRLFCKGADNIIFERLHPSCAELKELTSHHLNDFAQAGLRTLCLAVKDIDSAVYEKWKIKHQKASTSMDNRDDQLDAVYEEIETDLELLGATAIEDKLQDGVPSTIHNLAMADIKIWVLTGDKQETAINIGYSCRLLTDEMEEPFVVDSESVEDVEDQLRKALEEILSANSSSNQNNHKNDHTVLNGQTAFNGNTAANTATNTAVNAGMEIQGEEAGVFSLVISGHSLAYALKPELEALFLEVACMCKAVICCRVTPLQKALVVDLVKRHKKTITLAIGDGANDVSMIKMAHIGIGISGQEGMQAVLASDFSIAQFRYVERLLLVHGRWSYLRMSKFLKYFFYKNFTFTLCNFWFAFFCGFSAQALFDPFFISLYNVFYTSLPIVVLAIFDQDVDDHYSQRYPKLYLPGLSNELFNLKVFFGSVMEGILSSLVLFFIPYKALMFAANSEGLDKGDHQSFGTVVAATLVVAVNLRCALDMSYWTGFNHFVVWGSIIYYFCFQLAFYSEAIMYSYMGLAFAAFGDPATWFIMLLTCAILILPVVAIRFYHLSMHPTLSDRVRLRQRMRKSKSKGRELHVRRQSTFRRSQRSLRSGYAFSHQAGFGELITSGLNMKERAREPTSPVRLTKVRPNRNTSPTLSPSRSSPPTKVIENNTDPTNSDPSSSRLFTSTSTVDSQSRPEVWAPGQTIVVEHL